MNDIRYNTMSGLIEIDSILADKDSYMTFNEWWNGEGLEFDIDYKNKFSLHMDELEAVVIAAIATGMVDIKHCKQKAKEMKSQSKERDEHVKQIREGYGK